MKIGILSMQRIHNYGSFLQAFSLKKNLERLGHDVGFIDIEEGIHIYNIEKPSKLNKINYFFKKFDRYFFSRLKHKLFYEKMELVFEEEIQKYLLKNNLKTEKYDVAIIGSDEVFNCLNPSPWGFSDQLLGKISNAKHVVTYAASCGSTNVDDIVKLGLKSKITENFSNIDFFSVRDEATANLVRNFSDKNPVIHLDPVFILDYDKYLPDIKIKKPYILVYAYNNRISDLKEIEAIKRFAKKYNLDILTVGMYQVWNDKNIVADAFELLQYVKQAEYIITDTFHGTVFSIKYAKQFGTLIRKSNANKLGGLLDIFNLRSRSIVDISELEKVLCTKYDKEEVSDCLKEKSIQSLSYLENIKQYLREDIIQN